MPAQFLPVLFNITYSVRQLTTVKGAPQMLMFIEFIKKIIIQNDLKMRPRSIFSCI